MAKVITPTSWFSGYTCNGTSINFPLASIPGLSAGDCDPNTGDARKILYYLLKRFIALHDAKPSADKFTKFLAYNGSTGMSTGQDYTVTTTENIVVIAAVDFSTPVIGGSATADSRAPASDNKPSSYIPGYSYGGSVITMPLAAFKDLSAAKADAATGDIREILKNIANLFYKKWPLNDTGLSIVRTITNSTSVGTPSITTGQIRIQYDIQFKLAPSDDNVVAE